MHAIHAAMIQLSSAVKYLCTPILNTTQLLLTISSSVQPNTISLFLRL